MSDRVGFPLSAYNKVVNTLEDNKISYTDKYNNKSSDYKRKNNYNKLFDFLKDSEKYGRANYINKGLVEKKTSKFLIKDGLKEEAYNLYQKNIHTRAINTAIGYKELYLYFDKKLTLDEAIDKIKLNSRRYAKRQLTFFKNQFSDIKWYNLDEMDEEDIIKDILS